ncbi:BACON domain-containing protein [Alistipes shahii]|uniref:BACON domain-containing protein n=1 Tax=Alistipes shahii TaxID=328814 RepID=UPI003078E48C
MKTLKTFYLLTLSTLLSLAACSKDEGSDTPQPLTIEQTEYTLDAIDNRSTTLSFTASAAWTLSVTGEDSDWLTVTPSIGTAGSKSVTLTAAPRITEESRTAYVDIACGAQTVQITVTQTGASADADFTSLFDPVFADFLEQRNRFRNRKQLARKGVENSSEVVVFYRAPRVPKPISWRP